MGKKKKKRTAAPSASNSQIVAARLLLVLATALAGYLAWGSISGGSLAGCGPSSGCDKVLSSRWAYWLGIPVSVPALLTYVGLLMGSFMIHSRTTALRRQAWMVIIVLSIMVTGVVFWFTGLQVFLLKSFCRFCLAAHGSALVAGALLLHKAPVMRGFQSSPSKENPQKIPFRSALNASLVGMAGLAILVSGQLLVEKAGYRVKTVASGAPSDARKETARELALHRGTIRLNLNEIPMIGPPDAPHVIVSLFDYTCHHCRDMHGLLAQAKARFTNQLAIASIPMPLDGNCNHLVRRTPPAHANACEYAKLGLAVWRAKRESFAQFDSWVFAPPSPLSVDQVKQYAADLVGQENLERALADEWIARQLRTNVAIYEANRKEMRSGSMPQLILGKSISAGALKRVDDLYKMIGESFGLK